MNLLRKIKINKIIKASFSPDELVVLDFIKTTLSNLKIIRYNKEPNVLYYVNSNGIGILRTDLNACWVRHSNFWFELSSKHNIPYDDVKIILKYMIQDIVKINLSRLFISPIDAKYFIEVENKMTTK